MSKKKTTQCDIDGFRPAFGSQHVEFNTGSDLRMALTGDVGPRGITDEAADLVDFAAAVFQIERQLRGRQRTNPPSKFVLNMKLRKPEAWNEEAIKAAQKMLLLLGNAEWSLKFKGGLQAKVPEHKRSDKKVDQVVLFSGGMDSTCGAATLKKDKAARTRLVSYYTRQKTLQAELATKLGFTPPPTQWRMEWEPEPGRGHTFRYRSFLFLCLAAAVAESWGAKRILQFENGVLASAVPPSAAWMMTKHAHPQLHAEATKLFTALFDGIWQIENPFLDLTKRQCFEKAKETSTGTTREREIGEIVQDTETCWFHWANRVVRGKKKPGLSCGVCIPCILRRTALKDDAYAFDLRENAVRGDPQLGIAFRAYNRFLRLVKQTEKSSAEFYRVLPAAGRRLVDPGGAMELQRLHKLFLTFANEFIETFG
jgi:7-cyano-7-deazaguanine synthase in queuosine biosynthesis